MSELYKFNILDEINKFQEWQYQRFPNENLYDISGEWETEYDCWDKIYNAFSYMLQTKDVDNIDEQFKMKLIYIIARDNECEALIDELVEYSRWFCCLCEFCLHTNEADAKWQFASRLPECNCGEDIKNLILNFAEDDNEYVSRRALLAMSKVRPDKVEYYAVHFWDNKFIYKNTQDYRIIALLEALKEVNSPLFNVYFLKAKQINSKIIRNYIKKWDS